MDEMNSIVLGVTRVTFILLAVLFLGWALYPDYRSIMTGLIMGTSAGLINVRYLSTKIRQITQLAAADSGKKRVSFGFVTRICISFLAVMVAVRFEQVSLGATLLGLFLPQILTIPVSISQSIKNNQ